MRRSVKGQTKLPSNFNDFLWDNMNKTEPFDLLTENVSTVGKISRSAVRLDNYEIPTNSLFGYSSELEMFIPVP